MAQTLSDSCVPQQNQRVLLGILIDVSHSMQTSWRNQDGKPLPRIEVIRDAVNKKILEERKRNKERPEEIDNIDMFCLGFGFRYPLYIQRDITICEEDQPFQTQPQTEVIDLVCDLLALTDILPTKEELSDFKQRLNEKWHQCAGHIFEQATIVEDVFAELSEYVQTVLYESALQKHYHSILYMLSRRFACLADALANHFRNKEEKIRRVSEQSAQEYTDKVFQQASSDFNQNQMQYITFIERHLEQFVESYTSTALQALALGFTPAEIVNDLDVERALALAKQIYAYLDSEVRKHIATILTINQQKLRFAQRSISAKLDMKKVTFLTRRFVQKYGWDFLRPLIDDTIRNMFTRQFEEQAAKSFSHWIRLAAALEVIRPLSSLTNILPAIFEDQVYSEKVMFGATPFRQALDRAAARFIDERYKDHKKVLLIISDGTFREENEVFISANLLKRRGVIIISGLVYQKNLLERFVGSSPKDWPAGAKRMLEIASEITEQNFAVEKKKLARSLTGKKLCYQINHTSVLNELLETVFEQGSPLAPSTDKS